MRLVNLKTALVLKELGFRNRVNYYFEGSKEKISNNYFGWDSNASFVTLTSRPSVGEVYDWLYKEFGIFIGNRKLSVKLDLSEHWEFDICKFEVDGATTKLKGFGAMNPAKTDNSMFLAEANILVAILYQLRDFKNKLYSSKDDEDSNLFNILNR